MTPFGLLIWGCKDRQRAGYPIPRDEDRATRRHDHFRRHFQIVAVTTTLVAGGEVL
jgi:hypothetical protein